MLVTTLLILSILVPSNVRYISLPFRIEPFLGTGDNTGLSGDGGPATLAGISFSSWSLFVDTSNNLYIDDNGKSIIRKINKATGIITSVAGFSYFGNTQRTTTKTSF